MKKLFASLAIAGAAFCATAQSPLPAQPVNVQAFLSNAVANINTNVSLFTPGEVELRLGAVYSQKTGDAGTLVAVEKWDIFGIKNFAVGAEGITSGQDQAAEFAYLAYRHTIGNVAGILFTGAGYEDIDKSPLAVIGGRVEYRTSAHLGTWVSCGYGLELKAKNARGMLVGAGICYAF